MRILFYYPSNKRSIQIETTLLELKKDGNEIIFLTTCEKGAIHFELEKRGIPTYVNSIKPRSSLLYYLQQIKFLAQFSNKKKIDIVFANLQHANFIAVFSQYFTKAKIICFRHHFKFNQGDFGIPLKINRTEKLFDKVINRLAKRIVVPSTGVYNGIKEFEKIKLAKLIIIPYMYDFSMYGTPDSLKVETLKAQTANKFRIIMVSRLIPFKRHMMVLPLFKKLIDEGLNLHVFILDEGPERSTLGNYISSNNLEDHIELIGFTSDFLEYMKASDLLIHPSLTEASNNVVKEIGLMKKPVVVCDGVGDFNDYLIDGENGFLADKSKPNEKFEEVIRLIYSNPKVGKLMGNNLHRTILNIFSNNERVLKKYNQLIGK